MTRRAQAHKIKRNLLLRITSKIRRYTWEVTNPILLQLQIFTTVDIGH